MEPRVEEWYKKRLVNQLSTERQLQADALSSLIHSNLHSPYHLHSVSVKGATHTRPSFLQSIINNSHPKEGINKESTLEDVLTTTRTIGSRLQATGIFSSVDASLLQHSPDSVQVVFRTREKSRHFLKTSTELGNNEGSASLQASAINIFGGAESLNVQLSAGTTTRRSANATFSVPLNNAIDTWAELSGFILDKDATVYASCMEGVSGVKLALKKGAIQTGLVTFAYNQAHRHLHDLTPTASFSIRESTLPTVKSSLTHTFVYDSRNDPITPSKGFKIWAESEFAAPILSSTASFFKSELHGSVGRPLTCLNLPSLNLSTSFHAGLLHSLHPDHRTHFSDRFQLGGPTSVRSFKLGGMGIRDGPDAVGQTMYYSFGLSLLSPLPLPSRNWSNQTAPPPPTKTSEQGDIPRTEFHPPSLSDDRNKEAEKEKEKKGWRITTGHDYPVMMHWWVNGGRGVGGSTTQHALASITNHGPSLSCGLGILYRFTPLRLELNFGVPLVMAQGEQTRKGIQVGVGVDFM